MPVITARDCNGSLRSKSSRPPLTRERWYTPRFGPCLAVPGYSDPESAHAKAMSSFSNLEFHRSGIGVLTNPNDPDPGSAIYLENAAGSTRPLRFCSCTAGRRKTCRHLVELGKQLKIFRNRYDGRSFGEIFAATSWSRLATTLYGGDPLPFVETRVGRTTLDGRTVLRFVAPNGNTALDYLEITPASLRFLERVGKVPPDDGFLGRAELIDKLAVFLRTSEEQHLNRARMKTNRQSLEGTLWYRLCYHCFREFEGLKGRFEPAVDLHTGDFTLTYFPVPETPVVRIVLPRTRVQDVLSLLSEASPSHYALRITPLPIERMQRLESGNDGPISWLPRLHALLDYRDGTQLEPDVSRFIYGNLAYIPEVETLVELPTPDRFERRLTTGRPRMAGPRVAGQRAAKVPSFELTVTADEKLGTILTDPMRELRILQEFDFLEIAASSKSHDYLEVRYAFGDERVAIQDIIQAKREGLPYLETGQGWIDLTNSELRGLENLIPDDETPAGSQEGVRLSSAQILRLQSSTTKPVRIGGPSDRAAVLERLLEYRPSRPLVELKGLRSTLRPYQKIGVEWLHFLFENRLAGILCDDMGLGKTHQAMALMILLREHDGVDAPFLVICPRTVISHWRDKLAEFAPGLRATVYHGPSRDLSECLEEHEVVVASYGVLRNDADKLARIPWCLLFFDEIQQIKNQKTQAHRAALSVPAVMKIGLTGTPIENALSELKNLFDLVLPGYLGDDDDYFDRFGASSQEEPDPEALSELRRLIAPFVLRRLKSDVLDELPEKIEDIRTCTLSPEQRQLYRDTINTRGLALAEKIRADEEPLPYLHIFALLNLLKQICDHPALALDDRERWTEHSSRKWDLFTELLEEGLGSGQKVVVFTQYLGMIDIMESYLNQRGVPYAKLTGSTRKRGEVVHRFNNDEDCRVFLGSLRAGGTGIDLIAGSVVIHYDRWWNAAKEDQATDRVYRIGQKRAVQVFKIVTEDTLEESIAAMIDRKRQLMSSVVQADHPKLTKIFTREELLELLRQVD